MIGLLLFIGSCFVLIMFGVAIGDTKWIEILRKRNLIKYSETTGKLVWSDDGEECP